MSHFNVMVFGDNWQEQLAPFQENNMNDCPRQFLEFFDTEDEYRQKYENDGVDRVVMPDGRLLTTWDEEFRIPGQMGLGTRTHKPPEHLEIKKVPYKETFATFEEFMEEWCGSERRDPEKGRYGYWENPNKKWDWYEMGGRWSGYFRLRTKAALPSPIGTIGLSGLSMGEISVLAALKKSSPEKYEAVVSKYHGKVTAIKEVVNQLSTPSVDFYPGVCKRGKTGFADQALKGHIDIEYMQMEAEAEARQKYQKVASIFPDQVIPKIKTWKEFVAEEEQGAITIDDARRLYNEQDAVQKYKGVEGDFFDTLDNYQVSEDELARVARESAIAPIAVVKDGQWYESCRMGWWGVKLDEKDKGDWNAEFMKLFKDLPDDTLVTIVDCHI